MNTYSNIVEHFLAFQASRVEFFNLEMGTLINALWLNERKIRQELRRLIKNRQQI
jgi:hypothetical protein